MHTKIKEVFLIQAPVEAVWAFLMDPHRVVECMPGAVLEAIEDERNFVGNIELKMGFVAVRYRMQVQFVEIDHDAYFARIDAHAADGAKGGGAAKGTMSSHSRALPEGGTEVTVEVEMDLTGRMVEFGKGMIRSVSRQVTKKFVACAREKLEV